MLYLKYKERGTHMDEILNELQISGLDYIVLQQGDSSCLIELPSGSRVLIQEQ